MRPTRRSPLVHWVILLSLAISVPTSHAQDDGEIADQQTAPVNNLVHAPGVTTTSLGELGHAEKRGVGPTDVILIPGASFDFTVWAGFMSRNVDRYTMYAITPAGYGGTNPPPMPDPSDRFGERPWTEAMLEAIVELIRREQLDHPIVVGHHLMGDYYAMRIALDHPDMVGGVVVIAGEPVRRLPSPDGSPRLATTEERAQVVRENPSLAPFYKSVSDEMWFANTYKAENFCFDEQRGEELYQLQIASPRPTQIRYYLEYLTDDASARLNTLKVPMLVIDWVRPIPYLTEDGFDLDAFIEDNMDARMSQFEGLTREDAKQAMRDQILKQFGTAEAVGEAVLASGRPWGAVAQENDGIRLEEVEDSRMFVMEDQPARVDELIAEFAADCASGLAQGDDGLEGGDS